MFSKAELSYTATCLSLKDALRSDGRGLLDYRSIRVASGLYPQANGSARVQCGESQVSAAVTCSVLSITNCEAGTSSGGAIVCNVTCTPSAYPSLSPAAIEEKSDELTAILSNVYSHKEALPSNLVIIPGKKVWALSVDVLIFSEDGNLLDILFMAVHAALYDCRIPSTRSIQYKAQASIGTESGLDTRPGTDQIADFDLKDYWSDGEPLSNQTMLPVAITFHMHNTGHYLDATLLEAEASKSKILVVFSFEDKNNPHAHLMRAFGEAAFSLREWKEVCERAVVFAKELLSGIHRQLVVPEHSVDRHIC